MYGTMSKGRPVSNSAASTNRPARVLIWLRLGDDRQVKPSRHARQCAGGRAHRGIEGVGLARNPGKSRCLVEPRHCRL
jgi:hypothetical protein